jgi:predicted N-acetyltransferase YhbS
MAVTIRAQMPLDEAAIEEVTRRAFLFHPHSRQTEPFIIRDPMGGGRAAPVARRRGGGRRRRAHRVLSGHDQ